MTQLPNTFFDGKEWRRVLSRAEYEALPDLHGAWWRAWYARLDAAWLSWRAQFLDDETAMLEWDRTMMSVFPQPRGDYLDELRQMPQNERNRLIQGEYRIDEDN